MYEGKYVRHFKNLNFTEYESKAYLALLQESPLTGYAVAKKSGVPRSKIYEVLESLVIRGDVFVSHGNTPQYVPVPAKELIKIAGSRRKSILIRLRNTLKNSSRLQMTGKISGISPDAMRFSKR